MFNGWKITNILDGDRRGYKLSSKRPGEEGLPRRPPELTDPALMRLVESFLTGNLPQKKGKQT